MIGTGPSKHVGGRLLYYVLHNQFNEVTMVNLISLTHS
jgi:hypothetical protein